MAVLLLLCSSWAVAEVTQPNIDYAMNGNERHLVAAAAEGSTSRVNTYIGRLKAQSNQSATIEGYILGINAALERGDQRGLDLASLIITEANNNAAFSALYYSFPNELGSIFVKLADYSDDPQLSQGAYYTLADLTGVLGGGQPNIIGEAATTALLVDALNIALGRGDQIGLDSFYSVLNVLNYYGPAHQTNFYNGAVPAELGKVYMTLADYSDDPQLSQGAYYTLADLTGVLGGGQPNIIGEAATTKALIKGMELASSRGDQFGIDNVSAILNMVIYYGPAHISNVYSLADIYGDFVVALVVHHDNGNEPSVNAVLQELANNVSGALQSADKTKSIAFANARGNSTGATILNSL